MDSTDINDFELALAFNVENNPVCVILMPESLYSADVDVRSITEASIKGQDLTLTLGEKEMVLKGISPACVEAILMNCPLVVIDNECQYENLIPISRQHHD